MRIKYAITKYKIVKCLCHSDGKIYKSDDWQTLLTAWAHSQISNILKIDYGPYNDLQIYLK